MKFLERTQKKSSFWPFLFLSILSVFSSVYLSYHFDKIVKNTFYLCTGCLFAKTSHMTRLGGIFSFFSQTSSVGKECFLLSNECSSFARHALQQIFKESPSPDPSLPKGIPSSQYSWYRNQRLLSQIPAATTEEKKLLLFLRERWLSKSNGFYPFLIDWFYPCFGVFMQVPPNTTNCYSRNPFDKSSKTYQNRVEAWKRTLPHPHSFPLILTRPGEIEEYLPSHIHRKKVEGLIQKVEEEGVGGIRILSSDMQNYKSLLEWVGLFGLTATRVELDRLSSVSFHSPCSSLPIYPPSKETFISYLNAFSFSWENHPQKNLMLHATLQALKGLLTSLSEDRWREICHCPTRSSIVQISFIKIQEELQMLSLEEKGAPFLDTMARMEKIHAHLSSLLEIFSPFTHEDFSSIYRNLLTSIPMKLKPFTSCALHASGMTSIAGILKAIEKTVGSPPKVFCGENTYFECVDVVKKVAVVSEVEEADLLLMQFNPPLRRFFTTAYRVERIEEILHQALHAKRKKPLTLALDCTFDFIDSARVGHLLETFQEEIEEGKLNVLGYRSGIKFDLFGMDNYCGAPFFMIHNQEAQWKSFERLLVDPVLLTDKLSMNWFSLAYQTAAPELELYRKQIFENTWALLDRLPERLFQKKTRGYTVVPFERDADPTFLDIKVLGPLHKLRAATFLGGNLLLRGAEEGHPIFTRPSLGFYHSNFSMVFDPESSTVRLTVGLDPEEIDLLVKCFEMIDSLN